MPKPINHSVMSYIIGSIIMLVILTLLTLFLSYRMIDLSKTDAYAINLGGSLRMNAYQIGLYVELEDKVALKNFITKYESKLNDPFFKHLPNNPKILHQFDMLLTEWLQVIKPALLRDIDSNHADILFKLKKLSDLADNLVTELQKEAEKKVQLLRQVQLVAMIITLIVGLIALYIINIKVKRPLRQLIYSAQAIENGDFTQITQINSKGELALLGSTLNHACKTITSIHNQLENRVRSQTLALQQNNQALSFLFRTLQMLVETQEKKINLQHILDELANLVNVPQIELCLMTAKGERPYAQIKPITDKTKTCHSHSCEFCLISNPPPNNPDKILIRHFISPNTDSKIRFPLIYKDIRYGILVIQNNTTILDDWQLKLVQSVADQIALSFNLEDKNDQSRRIALLNERTVIARELHDSLAQALSYLKIQVTLLTQAQQKALYDKQPPIIEEIKTGINAAYRQLRELLTTFRLKMDGSGLKSAFELTIQQLSAQSPLKFHLNFAIDEIPLSPIEEIHLLQIAREACQNAVHHSQGQNVWIDVAYESERIILIIRDDGIGINLNDEKLNHYGIVIMQERAKHLSGKLLIENISLKSAMSSGTLITLIFDKKP